jgi:Signal transduction histidine kinase
MFASAAVPAGWVASRLPGPRSIRAGAVVGLAIGLGYWASERLAGGANYAGSEAIREQLVLWSTGAIVVVRVVRPVFSGTPMNLTRPGLLDLAIVGGLAAISVSLVVIDALTPAEIGAGLLLILLVLPSVRRTAGSALQKALLGDIREHARAEGADEERAKLARQLHDEHLQELTAVIRRLEVKSGTEAERDDLRDLASRLRIVASDLRPPVLEDFGLPGAFAYLAEQANSEDCAVVAHTEGSTGLDRSQRPPEEIELAVYRIAAEALRNATRHAQASLIELRATVDREAVTVEIADNGVGVTPADLRSGASRNRMGVGSMRRRAAAIDADFSISGSSSGTTVRVAWHR